MLEAACIPLTEWPAEKQWGAGEIGEVLATARYRHWPSRQKSAAHLCSPPATFLPFQTLIAPRLRQIWGLGSLLLLEALIDTYKPQRACEGL